MAPIFLCACLRIILLRGAKKGQGRDGRKPKTAVVGRAKVGRAKMGRPKLRVAERANIAIIIGTKRRQVTGLGRSRGMTGMRMTGGPGRSRGIGVGDRSRRNVWESRPSERLPQAPLVVTAVVVGALFNQFCNRILRIPRQHLEDK